MRHEALVDEIPSLALDAEVDETAKDLAVHDDYVVRGYWKHE